MPRDASVTPGRIRRRDRCDAAGSAPSVCCSPPALSYAFTDPCAVQFLRGLAESIQRRESGLLLVPQFLDDARTAVGAVRNAAVDGFCVFLLPDWHPSWEAIQARGLPVVSGQRRPADGPEALV
jgi:hypothetical protein